MGKKDKKSVRETDPSLLKRLKKLKQPWETQKTERKGAGCNLDNGTYIFQLTDMHLHESANGNLGIRSEWTVVRGEQKGETCFVWNGLDNEDNMPYTQGYLRRIGVDVDELSLDDIPEMCNELIEAAPCVRASIKINEESGFPNLRVLKLVELEDDEDDEDEEEEEDEKKSSKKSKGKGADDDDDEEEEEEEEEDNGGFEVGDEVTFTGKKGKAVSATIKKLKDGEAKLECEDGKTISLPTENLTKVGEEEEEEEDEEEEDETPKKKGKGKKDEEEEESKAPIKGDAVTVKVRGKEQEGKVLSVNKKEETCTVKVGKMERDYPWDEIEIMEE